MQHVLSGNVFAVLTLVIYQMTGLSGERIPDEQLLIEHLMVGYEKSVRPVINSSSVLTVTLGLKLNQIIDLDERHQVLTTNVFIDQVNLNKLKTQPFTVHSLTLSNTTGISREAGSTLQGHTSHPNCVFEEWMDANLKWKPANYNNVKSLRMPTRQVWLPDTFIYNNADDSSTGFMQGTYILVTYDGSVLWPVPVKLKSSCKVDITYFPFDDQECILRFGSWIYSGRWMDYQPINNATPIDLTSYVNNSEWDLLSVRLRKNIRRHTCCPDPHPDLTYILHIRRKTFYYIFNIIIPCVMLSVLTLLTFWLPPTSGEKITLGLSVFLAFSMFMLLIAEEVPATSEAVPLIGIYLCVVMTMTSLSVMMAVMVINIYNRGIKTKRAPKWLRISILKWLSLPLFMKHDLYKLASGISLEEEKEGVYLCKQHKIPNIKHSRRRTISKDYTDMEMSSVRHRYLSKQEEPLRDKQQESEQTIWLSHEENHNPSESQHNKYQRNLPTNNNKNEVTSELKPQIEIKNIPEQEKEIEQSTAKCKTRNELLKRKFIVAEWQRIATVIDRVLFWFYFLATLMSYLVILIFIPNSKYAEWNKQY